ncbi:MAG: hypothetical protein K6G79_07145 [Bacteroidales bacterium]|nr:hypothetical protein [Bacteroidales bacterium]
MDFIKRTAFLAVLFAALVCFTGCKEEEEEEYTPETMTGSVTYDIPYYVLRGELVTLSASGVEYPSRDVTYKWYITGVYSDTLSTSVVTVRFPDSLGTFQVNCFSYYSGFYSLSTAQEVTTIDTTWNVSLQGLARSRDVFVDERDGRSYGYVTLGGLDWFSQNLGWLGSGVPFRKSPSTASMFGCFYTWEEAARGNVCPEGWRLPDNSDWESLSEALGDGSRQAFTGDWPGLGAKASVEAQFNGNRLWPYSPDNAHSNSAGWNALPMGCTFEGVTNFSGMNEFGYWWSATEKNPEQAYYRYIWYDRGDFPMGFTGKSQMRASVRCVRTHPQS